MCPNRQEKKTVSPVTMTIGKCPASRGMISREKTIGLEQRGNCLGAMSFSPLETKI